MHETAKERLSFLRSCVAWAAWSAQSMWEDVDWANVVLFASIPIVASLIGYGTNILASESLAHDCVSASLSSSANRDHVSLC